VGPKNKELSRQPPQDGRWEETKGRPAWILLLESFRSLSCGRWRSSIPDRVAMPGKAWRGLDVCENSTATLAEADGDVDTREPTSTPGTGLPDKPPARAPHGVARLMAQRSWASFPAPRVAGVGDAEVRRTARGQLGVAGRQGLYFFRRTQETGGARQLVSGKQLMLWASFASLRNSHESVSEFKQRKETLRPDKDIVCLSEPWNPRNKDKDVPREILGRETADSLHHCSAPESRGRSRRPRGQGNRRGGSEGSSCAKLPELGMRVKCRN